MIELMATKSTSNVYVTNSILGMAATYTVYVMVNVRNYINKDEM